MSDLANDTILSTYTTVESKVNSLEISDGRLIFIRDKHTIALDFDGKRTFYTQIEELATDYARTSMLAPVASLFYFVVETGVLWTYTDTWIQITTPPDKVLNLDTTLTQEGQAADAKVVGDAIDNINNYIYSIYILFSIYEIVSR